MEKMNLNMNNLRTLTMVVINTLCINRTMVSGYANFRFES